jgi:ribosome modulation factor
MSESMQEFRDRIQRYHNADFDEAFAKLKNDMIKASPETRIQWLQSWDSAMAEETRITKDHAEWITKRREMGDLHDLLKRNGR